jgi:hypothetical protein
MGMLGQPGVVHDFKEQLLYSEVSSDEIFWDAIYRKAFPGMVNQMLCSGNTHSRRMGIDRLIMLASGKVLAIDEKKRKEEYNDILLEYVSVDTTNTPGWIEKDLAIDYLAYAFMKSQRVYLFDWLMLRRAWGHFKSEWMNRYPKITAQNNGYKTLSVAIPIGILRNSVSQAMVIQL